MSSLARAMTPSSFIQGCRTASVVEMRCLGFRVSSLRIRSIPGHRGRGSERGGEREREGGGGGVERGTEEVHDAKASSSLKETLPTYCKPTIFGDVFPVGLREGVSGLADLLLESVFCNLI